MKKTIVSSIMIIALVAAVGCKREELGYGSGEKPQAASLSFSLSSEGEFTPIGGTQASQASSAATKAGDETVDINAFSLKIVSNESGEVFESWERFDQVPKVIAMDPGTYTIEAHSPGSKAVSWDEPVYVGSQEVNITPGVTEEVAIVCSLSNMKVSVVCTEAFLNEMKPDFTVTVSSADGVLIFNKDSIAKGCSGYFAVAPLSLDLTAERVTGGPRVNHHIEISDVAPRDHHVFTLDAAETGHADLAQGLSIDYTCNNREEEIFVDSIQEDPVDELAAPELISSTIVDGDDNVPAATSVMVLTWSTAVKVSDTAPITLNSEPCTATASGNMVTVILPKLAEATSYVLDVPAGAVLNSVTAEQCAAVSLSFTTAGGSGSEDEDEGTAGITISATAGIDSPVTYSKASLPGSFTLSVSASAGIASYVVNVKSTGLQGLLDMMSMSYSVDLANMDAAQTEFWGSLFGITSADVSGKPDVTFEIAPFLSAMPVETNELEVVITDGNGDTLSRTLTIVMTE